MNPIILLADDHIMLTNGLIGYLQGKLGYRQVYAVASCNGILKELKRIPYTHLVLDIALADGSAFEILETLNNLYPKLRILLFSSKPADTYEKAIRKFKIEGYLSKNANEEETLEQLRKFLHNEPVRSKMANEQSPFSRLTARELEILHYLLKGTRLTKIAALLNVGPSAIGMAKASIFEKTGVKNMAALIALSMLHDLS